MRNRRLLTLALFIVTRALARDLGLQLRRARLHRKNMLHFNRQMRSTAGSGNSGSSKRTPIARRTVSPLRRFGRQLESRPRPTMVRNRVRIQYGNHRFVLGFQTSPRNTNRHTDLTELCRCQLEFVTSDHRTIARVHNVRIINTIIAQGPHNNRVLLRRHCPTTINISIRIFIVNSNIRFMFLVLLVQHKMHYTARNVRHRITTSNVTVEQRVSKLLRLTGNKSFRQFHTNIRRIMISIGHVVTAFRSGHFDGHVTHDINVHRQGLRLILAINRRGHVFFGIMRQAQTIDQVVQTVAANRTTLYLVSGLQNNFRRLRQFTKARFFQVD